MSDDDNATLTVEDLADILQLNVFTVRRHLRDGVIPGAIKVGRQWRLPRARLREFLDHAQGGTNAV